MSRQVKILIVDDHEMVRAGLRLLLSTSSSIEIVGEAVNGIKALEYLANNPVDVILMDINMPEMNGIECTQKVNELYSNVKVLAITMHIEEQHIKNMMKAGAAGYILKNSSKDVLVAALEAVMKGKHYYSQEVTSIIMEDLANPTGKGNEGNPLITEREIDVLKLIIQEKSNHEIADELFISIRTVDAHRRNLLQKTGAKNSVGLTKYAYKHKLFESN